MITAVLEDHGQDFLEWDIEAGVVVGCRPFQDWVWNGTKVHNKEIEAGDILMITPRTGGTAGRPGKRTTLKYRVKRVEVGTSV